MEVPAGAPQHARGRVWAPAARGAPALERSSYAYSDHGRLRAWQIGEIASRIGQLYYQFYLRKGDTVCRHQCLSLSHAACPTLARRCFLLTHPILALQSYLDEAYVFYEAIRARQYLGGSTSPGTQPELAVLLRRLRYYTRFCVVCMLTGRRGLLLELLGELDQLVHR